MTSPTRLAALVRTGDVIGYEGQWRKVKAIKTVVLPSGGMAVLFAWEEGGTDRFPAGDELLLALPHPHAS